MMGAGCWRRVEERGGRPVTILVIEDEPLVREVLQITLERSGFRVLMAGGGDEALDICESSGEPIDVVLTDIVMPGTSGTDLAAYLAIRYQNAYQAAAKVITAINNLTQTAVNLGTY